MIEVEQVMKQL